MKMVRHNGEPKQINPEEGSLTFEQFLDPALAVIAVLAGDGIIAEKKTPPNRDS